MKKELAQFVRYNDHHEEVDTDAPLVTFEGICAGIFNFFAALGLVSFCLFIGLWFGGYFHWVAFKFPNGLLAQIIGV
jgi:hypothetical protein